MNARFLSPTALALALAAGTVALLGLPAGCGGDEVGSRSTAELEAQRDDVLLAHLTF